MSASDYTLLIVLIHTFSTLYMMGLIWFVQVVHYPLKSSVGSEGFAAYQALHVSRTGWVVGPPMLLEAFSSTVLAFSPPSVLSQSQTVLGLVLLLFVWGVTALCSVPAHSRLSLGFEPSSHRRLVNTNWLRTIGWTLRGGLALYFLTFMIQL